LIRVTFNELAERELNDAAHDYELEQPGLGSAFITDIQRCTETFAAYPLAGSIVQGTIRPCDSRETGMDDSSTSRVDTGRLTLVRPRSVDAAEIFERYASDPEVTRFLGWARHRSIADTQAFLSFSASEWQRWPAGPYLIRARADERLLGGTGLGFETPEQAVTGYVLARDAWGHGYATEALAAVMGVAREVGVVQLSALCHPEHRASWRVLEKCGFVRDVTGAEQAEFPNLAPGRLQDVFRYRAVLVSAASGGVPSVQQQE
jgi:RimJ/RimL family protein N-acetyltransferase